jgi:hypothetical protein
LIGVSNPAMRDGNTRRLVLGQRLGFQLCN